MTTRLPGRFVESVHVLKSHSPSADMFNSNPTGDVFNMKNFEKIVFLVHQKANATSNAGTATLKISASSSAAPSNKENVKFTWSKVTTGVSDAMGTPAVAVAADGITTVANEDTVYVIEVDSRDMPDGKPFVCLDTTEVVNAPVIGSVLALGLTANYGYPFATALS